MNYQRALEILGLEPYFSDEILKKTYRNLARKYHPDNYADAEVKKLIVQEKMKEINAAHDYLERVKKETGSYHTYYNGDFIKKYKEAKIEELMRFWIEPNSLYVYPNYYYTYCDKLKKLLEDYKSIIIGVKEITEIDKLYNEACTKVKSIFIELQDNFFSKYAIEASYSKNLNYNCGINDFYNQLNEIKKLKLKDTENKIKETASKYSTLEYYDFLKSTIDIEVEKAINEAKKNRFHNINEIINNMHKRIKSIFDTHTDILKRFINIRSYFVSKYIVLKNKSEEIALEDYIPKEEVEIIKRLNKCIMAYHDSCNFLDTSRCLKELEEIIKKLKQKDKALENQERIKKLYNIVLANFNKALQNYNNSVDVSKMKKALKSFEKFLGVYEQLKNGEISIEQVIILQNLTFANQSDDNMIFKAIFNSNETDLKVYIAKKEFFFDYRFVILERISKDYVVLACFVNDEKHQITMARDEFENNFMSLDSYLNQAVYLGKKERTLNYIILYGLGDDILYRQQDGSFNIGKNYTFYDFENITGLSYVNKTFTKLKIMEWLQKKLADSRKGNEMAKVDWVKEALDLVNRKRR